MAATDQVYRNQKMLDIVFAVSSVLMLVSIIGMFMQDYNREWKPEQRMFRQTESALAMHEAVDSIPKAEVVEAALDAVDAAQKERAKTIVVKEKDAQGNETQRDMTGTERIADLKRAIEKHLADKEANDKRVNDLKSFVGSAVSFYNGAVDKGATADAKFYKEKIEGLEKQLAQATNAADDVTDKIKLYKREKDRLEKPLIEAQTNLKKATDDLVRRIKTAEKKQWGFGDWFRSLPVIDGFASPTKLHQFTLNELTIDYNFKGVTRFDRCMTCHQGIDRPGFTRENLLALRDVPAERTERLAKVAEVLKKLKAALKGTPDEANIPDPDSLKLTALSERDLTNARISEYAAHPRLDLFVGTNSKHPAEKFGCTTCHSGQPSGTEFLWASHSPNDYKTKEEWKKKHGWESIHFWDFHMLPKRFVEASCLKCHHQVTDLITTQNKNEAPKLVRGYNLIKDFGCYGCHEIHGQKDGRTVGPDLRLEPSPPLDSLPPAARERVHKDPENPPGTMRKVGPSLYRLSEKANEAWTARWILAPRDFRPDTKMPHFYGTSNNDPHDLPAKMKDFPNAEIYAVTHVLFKSSRDFLGDVAKAHQQLDKQRQELDQLKKKGKDLTKHEEQQLAQLRRDVEGLATTVAQLQDKAKLTPEEKAQLDKLTPILNLRDTPPPLTDPELPKDYKADAFVGRKLFTERGCLACHVHQGTTEEKRYTTQEDGKDIDKTLTSIVGASQFGPNLSQVSDKLVGKTGDPQQARRWLIHWLKNPQAHSPRSRMPITHLSNEEAAQIADWLLGQKATDLGTDWDKRQVTKPDVATLADMVKVFLVDKVLSQHETDQLLKGTLPEFRIKELPVEEKDLAGKLAQKDDKARADHLTWYVGRKGIGRLGCYGCHDIPGYEQAKPIGTGLAEWGKKDHERLAFENIAQFIKDKYHLVDSLVDENGKPVAGADGKPPYEKFFADSLMSHHGRTRDAYLYQKLRDPRSYDYTRIRPWDDLARMPEFKFARTKKKPKESDADYLARAEKEEADAREAVMTFVLGLVADPIPLAYLPAPGPERVAEIKGRQILDKFNCAGCHVTRPNTYEFKTGAIAALERKYKEFVDSPDYEGDHVYPFHNAWVSPTAHSGGKTSNGLTAFGTRSSRRKDTALKKDVLEIWLTDDFRFQSPKGEIRDLRGGKRVGIPIEDVTYPPREALASTEALRAFEKAHAIDSGAFAYLLAKHIVDYTEQTPFKRNEDSALVSVPPPLLRQGERTQPGWLYQFLREPQQVRMATLLRMPKFNMSEEEAKALVNYFSAVDKMTNPGIGLTNPYVNIPQRGDLESPYWREKTAAYIRQLHAAPDPDAKDPKKPRTLYDRRVAELEDYWKKNKYDESKRDWEEKQAYVLDGVRVVKNVCLGCHQLGPRKMKPSPTDTPGPILDLAWERLRPEWTEQWLANPQRFLPYLTTMPANFPHGSENFSNLIAGPTARDRINGIRDFLMIYPRVADQPIMRYWLLADEPPGTQTGEKK